MIYFFHWLLGCSMILMLLWIGMMMATHVELVEREQAQIDLNLKACRCQRVALYLLMSVTHFTVQ